MKAVFLDAKTFSEQVDLSAIKSQVKELNVYPVTAPEEVVERTFDADIIITNKVVIDADVIKQLPNLSLICVAATGVNNIDLDAATEANIVVKNVSGYAEYTLAQYVFSQILAHYSDIQHHNEFAQGATWPQSDTFCLHSKPMFELKEKTLGLVGYGVLAKAVERIALAFGMQVVIADRKDATKLRDGRQPFEAVMKNSDIISLHCPLTAETEHLIDAHALSLMKPTAMLINTARGAVVNSLDLKQALENNQIALAVLDVLEQEPPPADHPLLQAPLKNLKITGHIAWATLEAQQRLLTMLAGNIKAFKESSR